MAEIVKIKEDDITDWKNWPVGTLVEHMDTKDIGVLCYYHDEGLEVNRIVCTLRGGTYQEDDLNRNKFRKLPEGIEITIRQESETE